MLTPFARWVPKFHAVRRFDTLFFVARCPAGDWSPTVIEGECASAEWLTAAEVLDREQSGRARLIFPTRRTLERLAQHASFEAIRADALAHPIEPVTPWVEEHDGEKFITIPAHLGFPVTQERLDGLWRGLNCRAESRLSDKEKGTRRSGSPSCLERFETYFRWFDRCLFISNMLTRSLPPKIGLRVASATISRLFCGFCRLFLRMWSHTFETTWLRGSGCASGDLRQIRRRLNRAGQSAPRFTTSSLCHQALLLFLVW